MMFQIVLDTSKVVTTEGTSEGTQPKYRDGGFWYKIDNHGNEGLAEYLASRLLSFSDLDVSEYILYEQGTVNGVAGCRSRDFLRPDDELITFYRLYFNEFGRDLSHIIGRMDTMEERINYVVRFLWESCAVDVTDYLRKTITLDALILNEDRHLNNLALLWRNERFIPAPIFDNGISLLTANQSIDRRLPIEENVRRVVARPFSGSFAQMRRYFGTGFHLDTDAALSWLATEPASFERDVLIWQLRHFDW